MLTFGTLIDLAGIERRNVRLLRHQDNRYPGHPSPYILWRDDRPQFEKYQETQAIGDQANLSAPYWAAFVGAPAKATLFAGLYAVEFLGRTTEDRPHIFTGEIEPAGSINQYRLTKLPLLAEYDGLLWIDWGPGYRAWIQRGDRMPKPVIELKRAFSEPAFPGFSEITLKLSELTTIPAGWSETLRSTRGIYLLVCPRTREQYVGMASGAHGFLGRWLDYFATGHGGNVALKSREPSDYQVSILETVGTSATTADLQILEGRWKDKLQSTEMGLNRNR